MKKISVLSAICVIVLAHIVSAQTQYTQSLTFNDNDGVGDAGTYNSTDSFSFEIFLTYAGYTSSGLSLWFDTTANAAPHISLTSFTYGTTFSDPITPFISYPLGFPLPEQDGSYYTTPNPSDFGALVHDFQIPFQEPGTYFVGTLSVSLSGLAPGIYVLRSDDIHAFVGHASEVARYDPKNPPYFFDEDIPAATYTITIVPEPSTLALLVVSVIGAGIASRRRMASRRSGLPSSC